MSFLHHLSTTFFLHLKFSQGSFDSSVHISEEASNAAVAVPWAIVGAISIAGLLGWGKLIFSLVFNFYEN
jgi:hypothetical protein